MSESKTAREAMKAAQRFILTRDPQDAGAAQVSDKAMAELYDLLRDCALSVAPALRARIAAVIGE